MCPLGTFSRKYSSLSFGKKALKYDINDKIFASPFDSSNNKIFHLSLKDEVFSLHCTRAHFSPPSLCIFSLFLLSNNNSTLASDVNAYSIHIINFIGFVPQWRFKLFIITMVGGRVWWSEGGEKEERGKRREERGERKSEMQRLY